MKNEGKARILIFVWLDTVIMMFLGTKKKKRKVFESKGIIHYSSYLQENAVSFQVIPCRFFWNYHPNTNSSALTVNFSGIVPKEAILLYLPYQIYQVKLTQIRNRVTKVNVLTLTITYLSNTYLGHNFVISLSPYVTLNYVMLPYHTNQPGKNNIPVCWSRHWLENYDFY